MAIRWPFAIQSTLFAALATCILACGRPDQRMESACSIDAECSQGSVCRVARCRKACAANYWVGQGVQVSGSQGRRPAVVSGCDGVMTASPASSASAVPAGAAPAATAATAAATRLWVRYESGIEEQVELARIRPEHDVQAHATGAAK